MDNVQQEYEDLKRVLAELSSITVPARNENIFNVAGFPHYENVSSNILAFFLNPQNEHGLGNLILSSLLSLVDEQLDFKEREVDVSREVTTLNNGRIDLVVITNFKLIGIENKIYHYLANDLKDYSNSLETWALEKDLSPLKIVLSLKEEMCSDGFINITYAQLFAVIRKEIGRSISPASQKWLFYLVDFMVSIENLMDKKIELNEMDQFIIENKRSIEKLTNAVREFDYKLNRMMQELMGVLPKPAGCNEQWVCSKKCLVHDYVVNGHSIAFDLFISEQGWELSVFERNQEPSAFLEEALSKYPLERLGFTEERRSVLAKFELTESYVVISERILEVMQTLIDVASS